MKKVSIITVNFNQLQEMARDFARKEIIPRAEHYDRSGEWPWDIFNKARRAGLVNLNIPEEYGGVGASVLEECIIGEELAYGCSGIQTALMLNQLAALPILVAGTHEQKEKYFTPLTDEGKIMAYCMTEPDAGSDVASIKSTAIRRGDHYVLNGHFSPRANLTNSGARRTSNPPNRKPLRTSNAFVRKNA